MTPTHPPIPLSSTRSPHTQQASQKVVHPPTPTPTPTPTLTTHPPPPALTTHPPTHTSTAFTSPFIHTLTTHTTSKGCVHPPILSHTPTHTYIHSLTHSPPTAPTHTHSKWWWWCTHTSRPPPRCDDTHDTHDDALFVGWRKMRVQYHRCAARTFRPETALQQFARTTCMGGCALHLPPFIHPQRAASHPVPHFVLLARDSRRTLESESQPQCGAHKQTNGQKKTKQTNE